MLFPVSSKIAVLIRKSEVEIEVSEGLVDFEVVFFSEFLEVEGPFRILNFDNCTVICDKMKIQAGANKSLLVFGTEGSRVSHPGLQFLCETEALQWGGSSTVCWKHP